MSRSALYVLLQPLAGPLGCLLSLFLLLVAPGKVQASTLYTGWDGDGSISLSPPGGSYPRRASVTLTAAPAPGWVFERWGGDLNSTSNPLTVRMRGDLDAVAFFRCTSCGDTSGPFVAGQTYMGRNQYIEYRAGELPIIISAPHGGYLMPSEIPDRTYGTTTGDGWTEELIRQLLPAFQAYLAGTPHLVINKLDRKKLDANRELEEAAQGNPYATQAWYEFHDFLDVAAQEVIDRYGAGLYIDLHGQSDDPDRLQLGYLLYSNELKLSDTTLNEGGYSELSSIRALSASVEISFAELLRGPESLGGLLESVGYASVPSPESPDPGLEVYYSGGYNTLIHGSQQSGTLDGIQIESNMAVREDELARSSFAEGLAQVVEQYLSTHYGFIFP
ncbi:MAG: InlB B-repeat-containing protein [Myxococcota bacterium]